MFDNEQYPKAKSRNTVPQELPKSIRTSTAWSGPDLEPFLEDQQYCLRLDEVQIAELEYASMKFQGALPAVSSHVSMMQTHLLKH